MSGISLANLLIWYVVFLFSTTFHEFSHALLAYVGGDRTAYEGGQVSLDPMPHIRRTPFGLVVIPLISFFLAGGGWMIGWASAPYDVEWARRHPRKYAVMSAAGPMANLLLATIAFIAMKILVGQGVLEFSSSLRLDSIVVAPGEDGYRSAWGALAMALSVLLSLNVLLGIFNLMPVPPLDGSGVLEGLFPRQLGSFFDKVRVSGAYQFLGLIIAWKLFPIIASPVLSLILAVLHS